jgi:FKBP-type peptidyl-prolyl cis-trans isomerase
MTVIRQQEREQGMKKVLGITMMVLIAHAGSADDAKLETLSQKASYFLGTRVARDVGTLPVDFDRKAFDAGVSDALAKKTPRLSDEQIRDMMMALQKAFQAKQAEAGAASKVKGAAFLAENGKKKGVVTTKSGLQYTILKEGTGPKPAATDTVEVHYRGTLIDGTEFDSSHKRGQPATFPLSRVIRGWTEGLQLIGVGGKAKLVVPSDLGYGPRGMPPDIGPNETLIFEVELISIKK